MIATTDAALCITFPLLAIIAVAARFWARRVRSTSILADDWVIVFALLCSIITGILGLIGGIYGGFGIKQPIGPDGFPISNPKIVLYLKITYASQIVGIGALCGAKLSILLFYLRVFSPYLSRSVVFYAMFGVNAFWGFAYFMVYLLHCIPISDTWTIPSGKPRHCIHSNDPEYSYAITNVILDAAILSMPAPMIWKLKLPTRQKIAVCGIFLLGIIVTGIGIAKAIAFYNFGALYESNHQETYDGTILFYYTIPENCLAVIAACLPTLRPIFQGFSPESIIGSIRSAISLHSRHSAETTNRNSNKPNSDSTVGFTKIDDQTPANTTMGQGKSNWVEMENVSAVHTTCESDPETGK